MGAVTGLLAGGVRSTLDWRWVFTGKAELKPVADEAARRVRAALQALQS
jgi:hypothetical protein